MSYEGWKLLHLLGVVLLVGNVTVTSIWKLYADRTGDARIVAFAQRLVTVTDWFFTFWGVVLLLVGGFGAAWQIGPEDQRQRSGGKAGHATGDRSPEPESPGPAGLAPAPVDSGQIG
jgi:hypothetical protein